jgi:cell division protein FtsA
MVGARLEVDLHIATCSGSALQSTVTCANRAGLEVTEAVLESIAAAEATLSADERELGVCLLDIGAHSSDLAVFFEGAVAHTASVPIGGRTSPTTWPSACRCRWPRPRNSSASTATPSSLRCRSWRRSRLHNPQPQSLRLRAIAEILEPRARELFHL